MEASSELKPYQQFCGFPLLGNLAQNYTRIITSAEWGGRSLGGRSKRLGEWQPARKAWLADCLERTMKPFYQLKSH